MKYKSYPKYKDSGIEWLGEIPEEWKLRKIKFLTKEPIKNGLGEPAEFFEENWPRYIRITDIEGPKRLKDDTFCSLPPEIASGALVKKGDLLMSAVGATYGKSYLHSYSKGDFCYAGYLVKFSPNKELDFRYVGYWSESDLYWNQIHSNVIQSTIQNFSANKYQQLLILLPSLQEQIKIANYLDKKTEKIDAIIEKNKKQVELLKERRQAIISQAVTKGLNLKVKLVKSQFGNIPSHWRIKKIKFISRFVKTGTTPTTNNDAYFDGNLNWFTPNDFTDLNLEKSSRTISELAIQDNECKLFPERSVLLVSIGATLGKVAYSNKEFSCNQQINIIIPDKRTNYKYLTYYLLVFQSLVKSFSAVTTLAILNQDRLKQIPFIASSRSEQNRIVEYLEQKTSQVDNLIKKIQLQNQKLQEFRQSLISNIVTGKIKID